MPEPAMQLLAENAKRISMGAIIQRSGLTRQTIHFYLRKGLLPKPRPTSRTYALYPPETVDLLDLIRRCQVDFRLSLNEIAKVFAEANYAPVQIRAEMQRRKSASSASPVKTEPIERFLSRDELLAMLQPPPPSFWLDDVRRRKLLSVGGPGFCEDSVNLVQSLWALNQMNVTLDDLKEIAKQIDETAQSVMTEFNRILKSKMPATSDYSSATQLLTMMEEFVHWKRRDTFKSAFFHKAFPSAESFVGPNQKRVLPSETFLVKMGLNREIDRLLKCLDRDADDKRSLKDLARAYHLRSDWLNLYGVSRKILQIDASDVRAIVDQSRALYHLGRIDDAVALLQEQVKISSHPLVKFRLGQSLVLRSYNSSVVSFFDAVMQKQRLTAEALNDARDQPSTRRWIALDRALDNLSVSDPLQLNQPTIEELEALHDEYQALPDKGLSTLSKIGLAVGKILSAYALYMSYRKHHHPRTNLILRKVIQMDPHGVLPSRSSKQAKASAGPIQLPRNRKAVEQVG